MEKSVAMKMFLVMLVFVLCMSIASFVFAVETQNGLDDVEDLDLTSNVSNNTSSGNTSNNSSSNNTSTTNKSNTNLSTNLISSGNNTASKNNTANTSLPKTGLADSMPTVLLVVVFVISAGYAYKKIKEYRNI